MSSVRMCDKCKTVFSELADGWQTYSASTVKRDKDTGERRTVVMQLDACPTCAMIPDDAWAAQLPHDNDHAFERIALERENAELREALGEKEAAGERAAETAKPAA